MWLKIRNTFIIFLVSGFWHGANWTFIAWGLLNAIYIMPSIIFNTNRNHLDIVAKGRILPSYRELWDMVSTFILTVFAWIFFRAESMEQALTICGKIFSMSFFKLPYFLRITFSYPTLCFAVLFMLVEWLGREQQFAIAKLFLNNSRAFRWTFYYLIILIIVFFAGSNQQFIYFQF